MSLDDLSISKLMHAIKLKYQDLSERAKKMLENGYRPIFHDQVKWREEEGGIITALNPITGRINFLNPTLAVIFKFCNGEYSIYDIESKISNMFRNVEESIIKRDVTKALIELFINGYIKLRGGNDEIFITKLLEDLH